MTEHEPADRSVRITLAHVLRIHWPRGQRQRFSLRQLTLHDAEADALARGVRHPRTAIRRTQEADHRRMKSAAKDTAIAIGSADRIGLCTAFIRSIIPFTLDGKKVVFIKSAKRLTNSSL
jgi:hypothetical protein